MLSKSGVMALIVGLLAMMPLAILAQPSAELTLGMYRIVAEVAADEPARERGLMFREHLGANEGMVFVFPVAGRQCMWMKNTPIPLSVAFLDEAGRILNVEEMAPRTLDAHCAVAPARYALEMPGGWFRERGIAPGMHVEGLERLPAGR